MFVVLGVYLLSEKALRASVLWLCKIHHLYVHRSEDRVLCVDDDEE